MRLAITFSAAALSLGRCGGASPPPSVPSTPLPAAGPAAPEPPALRKDSGPPDLLGSGRRLCGCALCEPVFSTDACTRDEDCLPETACHATRCVGRARAEPRTPGTMCTQDLRCDSADANACGCLGGRCALHPRKE